MRLFIGVLALVPLFASAQTAYVTDTLQLGLHQASDTSDRPFRSLDSGQELEILSRTTYYANVQLPDGTLGWVKAIEKVLDSVLDGVAPTGVAVGVAVFTGVVAGVVVAGAVVGGAGVVAPAGKQIDVPG